MSTRLRQLHARSVHRRDRLCGAQFTGEATFKDARFTGGANFEGARVASAAEPDSVWPPGWMTRPANPDNGEDPAFLYLTKAEESPTSVMGT
ncbi:MAG: pentapeptide repeat-containing protein [Pseudonocardiaceae bacterium]